MLTRRELLKRGARAGAAAALAPAACVWTGAEAGEWVNDVHSGLNRTHVQRVEQPRSEAELQEILYASQQQGRAVSIAGGRHAMGGQQFGTDTVLVDMNALGGVGELDAERGQVELLGGTQWPELVQTLLERQVRAPRSWGIIQKQTGADRLSIGGALSANAHGRGLTLRPLVGDVEAFTLVDARGEALRCSRDQNPELFSLAIGGYGLFGVISSVRLRLAPRRKLERVVEVADTARLAERFDERIADGFLYGDFQYSTDLGSDTLLRQGVFSCYRPVEPDAWMPETQRSLLERDWLELLALGHLDRSQAFSRYAAYYLSTNGQRYWSDTHQLSTYVDDYHRALSARLGELSDGSEMISEIYVPRAALFDFLEGVRRDFLQYDTNLIYGTIRLIERDDDSFLAWAREPWACVIFNLHTQHDEDSLAKTRDDFRRLIARGLEYGGSYFPTYHRWATLEQVLACHPRLPQFLVAKRRHDPDERFQSDWYRHYRDLLL